MDAVDGSHTRGLMAQAVRRLLIRVRDRMDDERMIVWVDAREVRRWRERRRMGGRYLFGRSVEGRVDGAEDGSLLFVFFVWPTRGDGTCTGSCVGLALDSVFPLTASNKEDLSDAGTAFDAEMQPGSHHQLSSALSLCAAPCSLWGCVGADI
ncbi:hypothetical protein BJ508DRAFT_78392 [Ascobolus immersus RN42]|uniref:Uncharacterized protein n=1 Tax=Ascobolus immersus RN42 TaxID=1160509 RepID=A0A3N4IAG2_ASCIM|nr:hypothetical protein BJ508DRAFT_78392 [Ascobolus immersus RN42]